MLNKILSADESQLDAFKESFQSAQPFPHIVIEDFLAADTAREVTRAFPEFAAAVDAGGQVFESVNEHLKLQMTDSSKFSPPVADLHRSLSSPEFLRRMAHITGIPNLIADPELQGGGVHQTGPHGHLDVHVDFNFIDERAWHRRLNILVYLNEEWSEDWGGMLELWDEKVKVCHHTVAPVLGRCVIFATSERSFHGVTQLTCPPDRARKSFAAYYYTAEAPQGWDGTSHSTIFKARPDERYKGLVAMPLEKVCRGAAQGLRKLKRGVKSIVRRDG